MRLWPLGHECLTSHLRENVKCQLSATYIQARKDGTLHIRRVARPPFQFNKLFVLKLFTFLWYTTNYEVEYQLNPKLGIIQVNNLMISICIFP